ncbi:MAG: FecCD family ABC transporter permease [Lachnospirales bacterium]
MNKKTKSTIYTSVLFFAPLFTIFVSLLIGRYSISPKEVLDCLLYGFGVSNQDVTKEAYTVVYNLRLPRAIGAASIGMALAVSGTAFQGVFKNPLVDSGILGVSSGAGFGASLAIVIFEGSKFVGVFAFLFGILAVFLSYWIAKIYKEVPVIMLILGGTVVASIFSSLLSLLKSIADTNNELPEIVFWLMGSVSSVTYSDFWTLIPIVIGITILLFYRWQINLISINDKEARLMGIDVNKSKLLIIMSATLATAGAVCLGGTIGWVGLIIPQMGRMIIGNDNRKLLPLSISMGATFMVIVDTISRSVSTQEIPLGVLTSLIGAPFFIVILKKTKGGGFS